MELPVGAVSTRKIPWPSSTPALTGSSGCMPCSRHPGTAALPETPGVSCPQLAASHSQLALKYMPFLVPLSTWRMLSLCLPALRVAGYNIQSTLSQPRLPSEEPLLMSHSLRPPPKTLASLPISHTVTAGIDISWHMKYFLMLRLTG